jgi:hypothetical protein
MNIECIVCEEVCPISPKAIWFKEEELILRDGTVKKLKRPLWTHSSVTGAAFVKTNARSMTSPP